MERISTVVIQKLLDAFFLGLDAVDEVRRRVDRLMGRPEHDPFEVVWPEEESSIRKGNGEGTAPVEAAVAAAEVPDPPAASPAAAKPKPKPKARAADKAPAGRPKVPMEIEDLTTKIKAGALPIKELSENDEIAGKRMLARVIYVLGASEAADLGALTSTEIAHVLTFSVGIDTFGTNISRAIRQKTAGLVEGRKGGKGEVNRYHLTDEGRATFRKIYGADA